MCFMFYFPSDCGFSSGGGFAYHLSVPSYQTAAVNGYFSSGSGGTTPYTGYGSNGVGGYPSVGRGVPDVALLGTAYSIFLGGSLAGEGGSSASAPVFAAMVSLVNSYRLSKGLGTLGWINPSLYSYYAQFTNDVTSGSNLCSETYCCVQGFSAAKGW